MKSNATFRILFIAFASIAALSAQALVYPNVPIAIGIAPGGSRTSLPNGNFLSTAVMTATNVGTATVKAWYVPYSQSLNGTGATWNDATDTWVAGNLFSRQNNADFRLSMDRTVTDAPLGGLGVTTASSLDAYLIGTLAPGQSTTFSMIRELSSGITSESYFYTNVGIVAAVPEPTSLAVLGLGAAAMLRRRRRA